MNTLKTLVLALAVAVTVLPSCNSAKQATSEVSPTTQSVKRQGSIAGNRQATKINQPMESHRTGAATNQSMESHRAGKAGNLMSEMALSVDQENQFTEILNKYQPKIAKVAGKPDKVKELQQKKNKEIAKILTPEQFETYKAHMKAQMQNKAGQHMKPHRDKHPNPTEAASHHKAKQEEMLKKLNLTADQKMHFEAIHVKHRKEMESIRSSGQGNDREAMRGKMMDMRQKHMKEIKAILTPQQYTVYEQEMEAEMKKHQGQRGPGGGIRGRVQGGPR